jgi:PmbA protein
MPEPLDLLADLIARARAAGADAADAVLISGTAIGVQRRLGNTEHVERSEGRDLGLRVFLGKRAAIVSSSAIDPASFPELAERAVAMARVVPEDPYAGLAETAAALAVPGITNSEGAEAGFSRTEAFLVNSAGFAGRHARTNHSVSATALAGSGTAMQRDYDYHSTVHLADLDDAAGIGHSAGERAVVRLNPTRPKTAKLPVVYDSRVAGSLLGHLVGAINGVSVARGTTFLKDRLGTRIFLDTIEIHDDPRRVRGLRSRAFDGEGTPTAARDIVAAGVLTTWLLDSRSARQLGMQSTGHASRGTGGPPAPGPTNLYLAAGEMPPAELMADIKLGLYVTEMIGMGVNGVTGDYSRGASGFMIRDGAIAEPVAEITIAGNLLEMFAHLTPANDLRFRRGMDAPTVRVEGMTMAGA